MQGEYHVSGDPNDVLSAVIGSCVAVCLYDPVCKLGGMNHFLLPGSDPKNTRNIKYGAHSMEMLINAMLRRGALRERFEAQLYGGGNVVAGLGRISEGNAAFARRFIEDEGFVLTRQDLGGSAGRRLRFEPATGRAQVVAFKVASREPERRGGPPPHRPSSERVELF